MVKDKILLTKEWVYMHLPKCKYNYSLNCFFSLKLFISLGFWCFRKEKCLEEQQRRSQAITEPPQLLLTPEAKVVISFVPFTFAACNWEKGENCFGF